MPSLVRVYSWRRGRGPAGGALLALIGRRRRGEPSSSDWHAGVISVFCSPLKSSQCTPIAMRGACDALLDLPDPLLLHILALRRRQCYGEEW